MACARWPSFLAARSVLPRTTRDITSVYPELAGLAGATGASQAVLDGEIVAFAGGDWPDFEALQQRMNISSAAQARVLAARNPVSYLAFDLLWLNGRPLLAQAAGRTMREAVEHAGDRLRIQLVRATRNWEAIRGGRPVPGPGEWRHQSLPAPRLPYYPAPRTTGRWCGASPTRWPGKPRRRQPPRPS